MHHLCKQLLHDQSKVDGMFMVKQQQLMSKVLRTHYQRFVSASAAS